MSTLVDMKVTPQMPTISSARTTYGNFVRISAKIWIFGHFKYICVFKKFYMATVHNEAEYGQIAETVIMSGDPYRSKYICDNYLEQSFLYNQVRGMLGYTGYYKGKRVSVQGHGMGIPSIGIYSYELYKFYDVQTIIRVGTCGTWLKDVELGTVIIGETALSDSNYGYQYDLPENWQAKATAELVQKAAAIAVERGLKTATGKIYSSDVFYDESGRQKELMQREGILGVEMEATALYANAYALGRKALTILTVTDNLELDLHASAELRRSGLNDAIELALGML